MRSKQSTLGQTARELSCRSSLRRVRGAPWWSPRPSRTIAPKRAALERRMRALLSAPAMSLMLEVGDKRNRKTLKPLLPLLIPYLTLPNLENDAIDKPEAFDALPLIFRPVGRTHIHEPKYAGDELDNRMLAADARVGQREV